MSGLDELEGLLAKGAALPWSSSPQSGPPGKCLMAQVWQDAAGDSVAQSQLGHADISTTKRYVKVSAKDRLDALSVMRSREKSRDAAENNTNSETNQKGAL